MKHNFIPDQAGEVIATGKKEIEIPLRYQAPKEVFVCFKEEPEVATCAPNEYDEFEWEIRYNFGKLHHVLVLKWKVSGERAIFWAVKY